MVQDRLHLLEESVEEYGAFFAHSLVLLKPWSAELTALRRRWEQVMEDAEVLSDGEKVKYLGLNFLVYGYRGVEEYLTLVHENHALLQEVVQTPVLKALRYNLLYIDGTSTRVRSPQNKMYKATTRHIIKSNVLLPRLTKPLRFWVR